LSKDSLNSYLHKGVSKFKQNAPFMSSAEKQKKVAHLQKAHSKLKAKGGKFEEFEYGMHEELDEEQLDELSKDSLNSYLHKGVSKFKQNAPFMSSDEKQKKVAHLQKTHSKLKAKGGKFEEFEYGMNEEEEEDVAPWYKDKAEQDADKNKSPFKKKHNPNRTPHDTVKALAQKGMPKKEAY